MISAAPCQQRWRTTHAPIPPLTLAAAGVLTGCQPSESAGRARRLKLAYVMAPGGPAHKAAAHFADLVSKKTQGEITVKLYPNAQLGNDKESAEESGHRRRGLGARGHGPIGWYPPEYGAIEAPFVFRDYEHLDHVSARPHRARDRRGVRNETPNRRPRLVDPRSKIPDHIQPQSRDARRPEGFEAARARTPHLHRSLENPGANPTPLTYSEIFMGLKQGVVEGQENPLETIYTSSLHEVQKYLVETKHLLGVFMLMIHRPLLESLSPEHQRAIREAAVEAGRREHEWMLESDEEYVAKLKQAGMEFVAPDREAFRSRVVDELPKRFQKVWADRLLERILETN